jgi:hypothetical protein
MKIKALVTMLVLGSSSLALADHDDYAPTQAPYAGPKVRDHRYPAPLPAPVVAPPVATPAPVTQARFQYGLGRWRQARPVLLANDTRVSGWSVINVAATNRAFTKLELKASNGRTDLDRVMITFNNGQRQIVSLRGRHDGLLNGNKSLTIDLDGGMRSIKSVMLIGNSGRRGSIDILAS